MPRVAAIFVNDTYDEHGDGEFEGSALARIEITRTFSGDVVDYDLTFASLGWPADTPQIRPGVDR
ncbi:MAG TPA: hypothetical protein VL264_06330 [Gaiella sp.]|jgi:hypothetical protein|nr:hypothetical protein [Gaiella sp.]